MKRVITLLSLLVIALPCMASEAPVPQWSEFAPANYLNPDLSPTLAPLSKKRKTLIISSGLLNPFLPVTVLTMRKKAEQDALDLKDYWTRRKTQFDNEVATCEATTVDKAVCFMQLMQMESDKNKTYSQLQMQTKQVEAIHSLTEQTNQASQEPTQTICNTVGTTSSCNRY